jgi:hypothetical protein
VTKVLANLATEIDMKGWKVALDQRKENEKYMIIINYYRGYSSDSSE